MALGLLAAGVAAAATGTGAPTSAPAKAAAPCSRPEYRQFDFFVGDWDTFDVSRPEAPVARNTVTPMAGGCAVREVYEQNDGLRGESFSVFDASRGVWHQSWVTNRGDLLLLEGGLADGRMTLTARQALTAGTALVRVSWWTEGATVRERAERSTDGGKTFSPLFDIVFRRHRA